MRAKARAEAERESAMEGEKIEKRTAREPRAKAKGPKRREGARADGGRVWGCEGGRMVCLEGTCQTEMLVRAKGRR